MQQNRTFLLRANTRRQLLRIHLRRRFSTAIYWIFPSRHFELRNYKQTESRILKEKDTEDEIMATKRDHWLESQL